MKKDDIKFESLGDGFFVATSKDHKFGTDSFLLSNFVNARHKDIVCDLGTGCGIISILIYKKYRPKKIYSFDILESAFLLAKESAIKSNLSEVVIPINKDIKKIDASFNSMFDIIVCNPPYKAVGTGKLSSKQTDKIIRHETNLTLYELSVEAARLLKVKGRLLISMRAERLCDAFYFMRQAGLEPKRLQFCAKDKNSDPWLFLLEGKKGAKPFLQILPTAFVNDK